ncbi:hypothetical protein AB1L42_23375 [Thalassoglobus sp. JC818]|uniref:hypothetical protein n=1 Tax=Thalassoglobus sp. JC818 TaxID=3232136 RepID=UPI0034579A21
MINGVRDGSHRLAGLLKHLRKARNLLSGDHVIQLIRKGFVLPDKYQGLLSQRPDRHSVFWTQPMSTRRASGCGKAGRLAKLTELLDPHLIRCHSDGHTLLLRR